MANGGSPPNNSPPAVNPGSVTPSSPGLGVGNNLGQPPTWVHLKLCFWEATNPVKTRKRVFPNGLRIKVGADEYVLGDNGYVRFPTRPPPAAGKWQFTLEFPGLPTYVVCEPRTGSPPAGSPPPSPPAGYPRLAATAPDTTERFFMLPPFASSPLHDLALKHADWEMTMDAAANATYAPLTGMFEHQDATRSVGDSAKPVELTLDPHWQFLRFEFFDRHFGHTSHANKRVTVPPLALEGFRSDPHAAGLAPDTRSNWTLAVDAQILLQCLPWIVRRDDASTSLVGHMDGTHVGLRFSYPEPRYVHSQDAYLRTVLAIPAGDPRLQAGPNRLRYYDLPQLWKSRGYYVRDPNVSPPAGKFFGTLTVADVSAADAPATPLVFCLDDLVLCLPGPVHPLAPVFAAPDRVAVFNHRFNDTLPGGAARYTKQGLYKSVAAPAFSDDVPYSDVQVQNNYIFDYPDWTRMVAALGNIFEVFDQRTPNSPTAVVGARAAVRWVDAFHNTPRPHHARAAAVARADFPFYSIQPFLELFAPDRAPYNPAHQEQGGRTDLALLRCCDVDGADEVAVNLHYIRTNYHFVAAPGGGLTHGQYCYQISQNVSNRWTGDAPGVSENRAVLLPHLIVPSPPASPPPALPAIKCPVVWFSQSVSVPRAHCAVDVNVAADARDFRDTLNGEGESSPDGYVEDPNPVQNHWFPSAHENGHVDTLPDEYNERWNTPSYGARGWSTNLPGDPYERDDDAMMNGNRFPRHRHFWHDAEWIRPAVNNVPFKVKLGNGLNEDDYWLPEHPQQANGRDYYMWPMNHQLNHPGAPSFQRYDVFLYPLGKDWYSMNDGATPASPFDGIIVVVVKFRVQMFGHASLAIEYDRRSRALSALETSINPLLNGKWAAEGDCAYAPPAGRHFNKCLLRFVAQFLVENHPNFGPRAPTPDGNTDTSNAMAAANIARWGPHHFRLDLGTAAAQSAAWIAGTRTLNIRTTNAANAAVQARPLFARNFPMALLGVDKDAQLSPPSPPVAPGPLVIQDNDWVPIVQEVLQNVRIHRL